MADVTGEFEPSNGFIGYGTEFLVGQGGSPEDFVAVPAVKSITQGEMTTGIADFTHLRSPNRHREKKGTIRDSGPITVVCGYDPAHGAHMQAGGDGFAAAQSLVSLWISVAENNFKIIYPTAASSLELDIAGTITKYSIGELNVDGEVTCTFEITPLRDYFTGPA